MSSFTFSQLIFNSSRVVSGHIFKIQDGKVKQDWNNEVRNMFVEREIQKLLHLGHFELLKQLHAESPLQMTTCTLNAAARQGWLEVCQWLHAQHVGCSHHAVEWAAEEGHTSVVLWLLDTFFPEAELPTLSSSRSNSCILVSDNRSESMIVALENLPEWFTRNPDWETRAAEVVNAFRDAMESCGGIWNDAMTQEMLTKFQFSTKEVVSLRACIFHPEPTWQLPQWFIGIPQRLEIVEFFRSLGSCGGWTMEADLLARRQWNLSAEQTLDLAERLITAPGGLCQKSLVTSLILSAIGNGHLDLVVELQDRGGMLPQGAPLHAAKDKAAGNGHLDIVKWLHEDQCLPVGTSVKALNMAARNGHLETVRYLDQMGSPCTTAAMNGAAGSGHLEVVEFLHQNRTEGCTISAMNTAARNGHLQVVIWLHHNRKEGCSKQAMDGAAEKGHLPVLDWLHQNRTEGYSGQMINLAAANGHLHVLQWLAPFAGPCSKYTMNSLARQGRLQVMKFVAGHGLAPRQMPPFTEEAYYGAALHGHLEVVHWLFAKKVPTDVILAKTLSNALSRNHLKLAKWIITLRFPVDFKSSMVQKCREHLVKYNQESSILELDRLLQYSSNIMDESN